jgi:tRNA dimethylallyltransferase
MARQEIESVTGAGRLPILCGGTGLYLRTLLFGIAPVPEIPEEIRKSARQRHVEIGGEAFRDELAELDPVAAAKLHAGDSQRLMRAYEVVAATGMTLAAWQAAQPPAETGLAPESFILLPPRDALYAAIDRRFAGMVAAGALEEVEALVARSLDPDLPVMKAVGVPELSAYLAGRIPLDLAISQAQQASRRYAKRQFTWFRHQMPGALVINEKYSINLIGRICQIICKDA